MLYTGQKSYLNPFDYDDASGDPEIYHKTQTSPFQAPDRSMPDDLHDEWRGASCYQWHLLNQPPVIYTASNFISE